MSPEKNLPDLELEEGEKKIEVSFEIFPKAAQDAILKTFYEEIQEPKLDGELRSYARIEKGGGKRSYKAYGVLFGKGEGPELQSHPSSFWGRKPKKQARHELGFTIEFTEEPEFDEDQIDFQVDAPSYWGLDRKTYGLDTSHGRTKKSDVD